MILVDTSIWIDHLHRAEPDLQALLDGAEVCSHPMVVGELTLGSLHERRRFLALLADLPTALAATHPEVLRMVESHRLFGAGLSLVGAHLLAAVRISPGHRLWTRDRRLRRAAQDLLVAADLS